MLRVFRSKKFARRTLITLLILIIPAFVLWGAGSISKGQKLIGTIDKQKIYPDDFFRSLQGMKIELLLYYMNFDSLQRALENRPAINRMTWERLVFLSAAESKNINIANRDVLIFLARHPLFQRDGNFDHKWYQHIIKNVFRMEPRQFEELVRENLQVKALQIGLYKEIVISDEELMRKYKQLNDKITISYLLVDKTMFTEVSAPTPEEIKLYYDVNIREFQVRVLAFENVKDEIAEKLSDDKRMRLAYEAARALYEEISEKNISLEEAGKTIEQNCQTAEAVSLNGYIENIGPAGTIVEKALETEPGAVCPPINTPKGAVIVRVDNIIPADEEKFKEQKDTLFSDMVSARRQEVLARWFREKAPKSKLHKSLDEL